MVKERSMQGKKGFPCLPEDPYPHNITSHIADQIDMMLDPGVESSHAQTSLRRALDSQVGTKVPELVREKAQGLKVRGHRGG